MWPANLDASVILGVNMTEHEKSTLDLDALVDNKEKRREYEDMVDRKLSTKKINAYIRARTALREDVGDIKKNIEAADKKKRAVDAITKAMDSGIALEDIEQAVLMSKLEDK